MLKRPSSRRKSKGEEITLNLVPVLDTMVTLIGFLLFTMSFLAFVHIESPLPVPAPNQAELKLKEKPLQLTVSLGEKEATIWSPFDRIAQKKIPNTLPEQPDTKVIHETLLEIKKQFPQETKVVLVPTAGTTYDVLISVMDNLRAIDKTDPPIFVKNAKTGNDEPLKILFPEVIFGNLLGDS